MYHRIASIQLQNHLRRVLHAMNSRKPKRPLASTEVALSLHEEPPEEQETPQPAQNNSPKPRREGQETPQHAQDIHLRPRRRGAKRSVPTSEHCSYFSTTPGTLFRLGSSGYTYKFWHSEGSFYHNVPEQHEFQYYASEFDTVEINATFYRWFRESVWDNWRVRATSIRPSFEYVIKANQYYSHMKRLNVDDKFKASWAKFYASCQRLGPHLGPILFQFPESFKRDSITLARMEDLGKVLDPNGKFVFEFRHISWFCPELYVILKRHNWCLALVEVSGAGPAWCSTLSKGPNPRIEDYPLDSCTWGAYVRFHGAQGKYIGAYGPEKMTEWAWKFAEWTGQSDPSRRVYAAFNNTDDGRPPGAIADPRSLADALRNLGYT